MMMVVMTMMPAAMMAKPTVMMAAETAMVPAETKRRRADNRRKPNYKKLLQIHITRPFFNCIDSRFGHRGFRI